MKSKKTTIQRKYRNNTKVTTSRNETNRGKQNKTQRLENGTGNVKQRRQMLREVACYNLMDSAA